MRQYELTYLVSDKVPETDLNKITGKVGGFIADDGGKILKEEIWKRRKLAYPIKKQEFATFVTLNFEIPAETVQNFSKEIKLTPQIIRHLLILKEMGEEKLSLLSDEIVGAEEIESVLGGEKSFEAVEGETEESRKLMAKREEEEKEEDPTSLPLHQDSAELRGASEETKDKEFEAIAEEKPVEIKKPKKTKVDKKEKITKSEAPSEADRLAKLDEEIDELLKGDL